MDTSRLLNYLKIVSNLEKEKYTLNCIMDAIQQEMNTNKYYNGVRPTPPSAPVDPKYRMQSDYQKNKKSGLGCLALIFIPFFIFSLLGTMAFVAAITNNSPIVLIIFGVAAVAIPIFTYVIVKRDKKKRQEKREEFTLRQYNNQYADYQDAMVGYKTQMQVYEKNVKNFEAQQRHYKEQLRAEYNRVKNRYDETCKLLNEYYALNIIPEKYQELIPVCMFYDYVSTGRTYSMERNMIHNDPGAINMYVDDVYRGKVLGSLSDIRNEIQMQSSAIQSKMSSVSDAIQEGQAETKRYLSSVKGSIDQSNYLQRQTNNELEEQNYLTKVRIEQDRYRNDLMTRAFYR